jgi:hypothetical protein
MLGQGHFYSNERGAVADEQVGKIHSKRVGKIGKIHSKRVGKIEKIHSKRVGKIWKMHAKRVYFSKIKGLRLQSK